jgi:YHS domain-containing protein
MKKFFMMLIVMMTTSGVMALPMPASAEEGHSTHAGNDHAAAKPVSAEMEVTDTGAVEVGNKICPVSGEKVGQMGEVVKVEYKGKIYNLCCAMCEKDFLKNPEKYREIAEEEAEKSQEAEGENHQGGN